MRKILITSLSVHWMAVFMLCAFAAAPSGAEPLAPALALATGHALVAALFLWTAIAALGGDAGSQSGEIAGLALAVAALVLGAGLLLDGAADVGAAAMQLAGLGATCLVIRAEAAREASAVDRSAQMARRLALGAAHSSMLPRRGPGGSRG